MIEICRLTKRQIDPSSKKKLPTPLEQVKIFSLAVGHGIGSVDFVECVGEIEENTYESQFNLIREYAPDLVVIGDAMTGIEVGTVEVIDVSDDREYMYSTHNLPMPILVSYLKKFCKGVLFLGLNVDIENVLEINPEVSEEAKVTASRGLAKLIEIDTIFDKR